MRTILRQDVIQNKTHLFKGAAVSYIVIQSPYFLKSNLFPKSNVSNTMFIKL